MKYLNELNDKYNNPPYIDKYAIYDMNRDGMPELLYWASFHLTICVYQNDSVEELDNASFNAMNGPIKILANGAVLYKHISTGTTYCYEELNKDNTLSQLKFGEYEAYNDYWFNEFNEKVTKDEWHELTKDIFAIPEATDIEWKALSD